ncbi:phospholipid scramblase 1-like [Mytilus trossulus]|uniref:phospholipid scramblase 1-like n=1 Tax=Mytilus trossulus TaxID=6551 RepID=UPI003005B6A1
MAQIRPHDDTDDAMKRLGNLDEIIVKQHLMNFDVKGYKFSICDSQNQQIMEAVEESDDSSSCWRLCCSRTRPLVLRINNNDHKTLMELKRPYRCSGPLCCCLQFLSLKSPSGFKLGEIKQNMGNNQSFAVRYGSGTEVFTLIKDESSNTFKIKTKEKDVGILQDLSHAFTEENKSGTTNEFKLSFSEKLSVSEKALILSAAFLIDMFYMDNGLLRTYNTNTMTGETIEIEFYNCKYTFTRWGPGFYEQVLINILF